LSFKAVSEWMYASVKTNLVWSDMKELAFVR